MIKILIISLASALALTGCSTFDSTRDGLAQFIETEERREKPDRVRIETVYEPIPSEYYDEQACPPPVSLTPQEIARLVNEGDYNEHFVAPLFANNETCFLGMRRIERYSEDINTLNEDTRNSNVKPQ